MISLRNIVEVFTLPDAYVSTQAYTKAAAVVFCLLYVLVFSILLYLCFVLFYSYSSLFNSAVLFPVLLFLTFFVGAGGKRIVRGVLKCNNFKPSFYLNGGGHVQGLRTDGKCKEGVDWINLALSMNSWLAIVNASTNLLVPQKAGNFLTS